MSPATASADPGAHVGQPEVSSRVGRFLFDHTLSEYPEDGWRFWYLGLAILATILLYYVYYTQFGVTPNILATYHMTFAFYVGIVVVSNLLGAFASLPASLTDRLGRTNVIIYGLLIISLMFVIGIPLADSEWSFAAVICLMGIVEGAVLVATPALVRDFSPQLGRASAMGFWTIGPVTGSLITAIVANHTLNHFGATHWKSQFIISGISGLVVFVISLLFLKDLSPQIRDQLMVSARDRALVEARARGLSEADIEAATKSPWRQILRYDLVLAALGIALFLLIYYVAASFFTVYYPSVFLNANNTNFTVTTANGLNQWFWGTDIAALIVVGLLSDLVLVRKPFMLVGSFFSMVMLVAFASRATHPHTSFSVLATLAGLLAVGLSMVFAPWMASYTENVEAKNPALVATGLALWGWILRLVVGISFIFLPAVITSVNPIVDNLPVAQATFDGQPIQDFVVLHADSVAFAEAHAALLDKIKANQAVVNAVAAKASPANIAAASKALGPVYFAQLVKYQSELKTLVQPYEAQLNYLSAHQAKLTKLENGVKEAPKQWQRWFWIDLIGMVLFVPTIWLAKGRWNPARAKRDEAEHERRVAEELAKLAAAGAPTGAAATA